VSKFKFLRKRSDYYRHFTVLDIGTDLIKVLVVRRDGPDGEVLGVGREPQGPAAMSGGAIADLESVIQSCNRALEAAEDMAKTVPGQVVVGIAGELIKGFSSTIAYPRENPKSRVRSGEMSTMLQMVQRRALREAQHLLELERSYGQLEARLVHSAITNVRVDGYPVTNPVGFTGKNLEVTVFNTFAPMTHIDAIETVVRELDLELAAAVAQPYALARACANEEIWAEGGIFVDVGGGTTDVALIRDGGVEGTRMFNLGGRAFTRLRVELRGSRGPQAPPLGRPFVLGPAPPGVGAAGRRRRSAFAGACPQHQGALARRAPAFQHLPVWRRQPPPRADPRDGQEQLGGGPSVPQGAAREAPRAARRAQPDRLHGTAVEPPGHRPDGPGQPCFAN